MEKIRNFKYEIYVFILFVLSRLPMLGYEMFNTDVWKWKQRIYDFGTGVFTLNFEQTIQRYHPGVGLMWIGAAAIKVFNFGYRVLTGANPPDNNINVLFQLHLIQKLFIVLTIAAALAFVFMLLKRMFGVKYAAIAITLLSLEPFYVALTRVVHLEGLMSTFMIASFVSLYYFAINSKLKKYLYLSAFFGTLAVLTKTSALFLVPFTGLLLFGIRLTVAKKIFKSLDWASAQFLKWLAVSILLFVALWPAMWTNADAALRTISKGIVDVGIEGGHEQFFLNEWVEDPGPTFYLYVFLLRTSLYMIPGLVGLLFVYKKLDSNIKQFVIYTFLFSLLYWALVTYPSKKLDRYLLPSILGLSLISSFYFERVFNWFKGNLLVSVVVLFAPAIITLGIMHPDYFSYFSIYGGGLEKGIFTIEPKWVIGQHELMDYLDNKIEKTGIGRFEEGESLNNSPNLANRMVVAFPEKYYTQLHPLVRKVGGWATISSIKVDSQKSVYYIFPVWFDPTDDKDPWSFEEQVYLRGVPVYNVYTNNEREL